MRAVRLLARLWADRSGAAAVELALVLPLLSLVAFGLADLGGYFWNAHIVAKAVHDGARYASRRAFGDYAGCAVSTAALQAIRDVTRTGRPGGTAPLLRGWTDAATITVSVECAPPANYRGVYERRARRRRRSPSAPPFPMSGCSGRCRCSRRC